MTYMDRTNREKDRHDLLEDHDETGKDVPSWVFDAMTLMPYIASCSFTLVAVFVVLQYGMKFKKVQEEKWLKGSLVGLSMNLLLLEVFRIIMMTLVELRKYENRKKMRAGHFLPRRVRQEEDTDYQPVPPPRLWKNAVAAPAIPLGKRPEFLPKQEMIGPPPPKQPPGAPPFQQHLPLAPPAPVTFSASAMQVGDQPALRGQASGSFRGGLGGLGGLPPGSPGPATPKSMMSASMGPSGARTPPGARTPGGTIRQPGGAPKLATAAHLAQAQRRAQEAGMAPPSPAHSQHSLSSLRQSLNQQVKDGRHKAPPPPPGSTAAQASRGPPPPAPSAPAPSYSRPSTRPTSAASKSGAPGRTVGTPPGARTAGAPPPPARP